MNVHAITLAIILGCLAGAADAQQEIVPPPPVAPKDIGNYCIYANKLYSSGAQICVVRGSVTLGCDKGEWKIDLTKYGVDCRAEPPNSLAR